MAMWDNLRMISAPRRMPAWAIAVVALLAALVLYNEVGPVYAAGLLVISAACFSGYRYYRSPHPREPVGIRCLKCGETLPSTARRCDYCGSASWTYRN